MSDPADVAQHVVDVSGAEDRADVVAAYYRRLKKHRVPEVAAREFTVLEFFSETQVSVWLDEEDD